MQRTLVIGNSGGIGSALAERMSFDGEVVGLSRSGDGLDVTDEASIVAHLSDLKPPFDRIVVATGALEINGLEPEKSLSQLTPDAMMRLFFLNAIGPGLVLKHARRLLPGNRRSVLAVLSARVGSIGDNRLGGWYSYRASKAGLNQVLHTAAIELARTHKHAICVSLHPGTVATEFTEKYVGRHPAVSPEEAAENLTAVIDGLSHEDSGGFFDWAGKRVPW
jgi:NAD(P)-dependent dehydrogenase (short-subunit alcohol dehydrogenase family)